MPRVTRRDVPIAVFAAACTAGAFALTGAAEPVMHTALFEWNSIPEHPNATGSSRDFFNGRTLTLDQLYLHVSTLIPAPRHMLHIVTRIIG